MSTLTFDELDLSNDIKTGISNAQLTEASTLQQTIISHAADGKNLIAKAEPGEEKNTAIAITALERLQKTGPDNGTCVLVLVYNAETAVAICNKIKSLDTTGDHCFSIDSGGDIEAQAGAIDAKTPIIVATPDRLQELLKEHRFIFRSIELLILDEMDELVKNEQENLTQIKRRILSTPPSIICSGTMNEATQKACESFSKNPEMHGFDQSPQSIRGDLQQGYINVPNRMKISTLVAHIGQKPTGRTIVFTASKRGTDRLYRVLKKRGLKATSLHKKLSDQKRAQRLANFTNSDVQFLLVADFSATELEVNGITQVINYDVPNTPDEYRYRAALVASGKKSRLVSLVSKQDQSDISQLENELGQKPEEIPLPKEVKQKIDQRKTNKKKTRRNGSKQKKGRPNTTHEKKEKEPELPKPSYEKLSGGRNGNYNKKETGIVKFFKKLFS